MITGVMVVGETRNRLHVFWIHLSEKGDVFQSIGRIPNMINDTLEGRHIVGERHSLRSLVEVGVC